MTINSTRRRIVAALAAAPVVAGAPSMVRAQSDKPVTIVMTVPPGSSLNTLARLLSERLRVRLNRPFVVDSKPGAGGLIAINYLKSQDADGATLMMAPMSAVSLLPLFTAKPTFDLDKDLYPVVECTSSPFALTVNSSTGLKTLAEYFDSVRKDPTRGSIGVPSVTSTMALVIYQLRTQLGLPLQAVGYRGGAPLHADLLGNQIPASGSILPDYLGYHRGGRVRVLAHLGEKRSALAPEIPTFAEAGFPGYTASTSFGLYARAGIPQELAARYAAMVTEELNSAPVAEALQKMSLESVGGTPEEFLRKVLDDPARWAPVIKASGIKMDS